MALDGEVEYDEEVVDVLDEGGKGGVAGGGEVDLGAEGGFGFATFFVPAGAEGSEAGGVELGKVGRGDEAFCGCAGEVVPAFIGSVDGFGDSGVGIW